MPHEHVLNRIRTEYLETPGGLEQVQRPCGVERTVCQMVLARLGRFGTAQTRVAFV